MYEINSMNNRKNLIIYIFVFSVTARIFIFWSDRIINITSLVLAMLLLFSYNGYLVSFLTIQKISLPFENLNQLKNNKEFELGVVESGAMLNLFKVCYFIFQCPIDQLWEKFKKNCIFFSEC